MGDVIHMILSMENRKTRQWFYFHLEPKLDTKACFNGIFNFGASLIKTSYKIMRIDDNNLLLSF